MASALAGKPAAFVNADVALDGEPVIGSFTVNGLTFAVTGESTIELVGVSPSVILSGGSEAAGAEGSDESHASEAGVASLTLPETITYEGVDYTLASIGGFAFYLSGVASVTLPASVSDVDDRAFRSSDVASVAVAEGNQDYSSFDGALYSADKTRLLLIPEGRVGAVLLPREAEVADPGKFSHCSLVDAISVEDGAAFASENGLLYTSDLTTLLRVPAGAEEITIRDGCIAIAAGALEACAKLATINAPASVTSISPDIFHAVPVVSLPAASALQGESTDAVTSTPQLTAMVALSSDGGGLPEVNPMFVTVCVQEDRNAADWKEAGFETVMVASSAALNSAASYAAGWQVHCPYGHRASDAKPSKTCQSQTHEYDATEWNVNEFDSTPLQVGFTAESGYYVHYLYHGAYRDFYLDSYCYGVSLTPDGSILPVGYRFPDSGANVYYHCRPFGSFSIRFEVLGGSEVEPMDKVPCAHDVILPAAPNRPGYRFLGWDTQREGNGERYPGAGKMPPAEDGAVVTLYAQWERVDYDLGFDVDSEPGDEDYKGEPKDDQTVNVESGPTAIEDPKRPGYVFQGWTIPDASGTHGNLSSLVYKDEDGKWYVDASKLPDYAGDDGRVELTARWTSVISVDVPSSVTFYADVVTQGNESREGLASGAFGQSKVASQSEVDLRIVGLESEPVRGNGTTSLGATDLIKGKDGKPVSTTVDMLFSVYPVEKAPSEGDLKDPDRKSEKPEGAANFALDDILLEKEFASADFSIPAGKSLNLGYRLNLQETGAVLDYDKLSTLSEGTSASIANISYCFAADAIPSDWGEPLWIENPDRSYSPAKYLLLKDIKDAADDLSAHADDPAQSEHYSLYSSLVGTGTFHLKVDGKYLDIQLLGICQDAKTAGGKAGLTFQTKDIYAHSGIRSSAAGGGEFPCQMNPAGSKSDGWASSAMNDALRSIFWGYLPEEVRAAVVGVDKFQQLYGDATGSYLQKTSDETIWLPSMYEVFGTTFTYYNDSEGIPVDGYIPFQYQAYAGNGGSEANAKAVKTYNGSASRWWLRSALRDNAEQFCIAYSDGYRGGNPASDTRGVAPCFCL